MVKTKDLTGIFLAVLFVTSIVMLLAQVSVCNALTPHSPIYIDGNDNFTPANGVLGGSGTENDPYIIENWDISAENTNGIWIENTTAYFIVRNCFVHDGGTNWNYGIFLDNVANGNIENATIENNLKGIYLVRSDNNLVTNCDVSNQFGEDIRLDSSNNNRLTYCDLSYSENVILHISHSSNNIISGCNISNSLDTGLALEDSSNNFIYHNNFENNPNQAIDWLGTNSWDNGYPSGGNYWSDYAGLDNYHGENQNIPGPDGIGDTPYIIPIGTNQDRYPLMGPWPTIRGVSVSISPPSQSGVWGSTLTYTVTVTNTGNVSDTYSLENSDNDNWVKTLNYDILSIPPGDNKTVTLSVTVPIGGSEDNITVVATSQAETTLKENASCIAQLVIWVNTGDLENASHVYSLLSASDGAVYAGTASNDDPWNSVGVVFKTTDGGTTWVPTASMGGLGVVGNIEAIIQTSGGTIDNNIFVGTAWEGKIFRSTNGGDNWIQVVDLPGVAEVDSLIQAANGDLYAGTHYGGGPDEARIYRSTDYGVNWQVVAASSIDNELSGCTTVECLMQASTGYFYCGTLPGHVWCSYNGDNWYKVGDRNINFGGSYKIYSLLDASNGYIYAASRGPGNVYRSTDNGNTWAEVANGVTELGGAYRTDGLCQASNGTIYVGTDVNKIYRSTDGDNWVLEVNLSADRVNAIVESTDHCLYAGTSFNGDVFKVQLQVENFQPRYLVAGWSLVCFTGAGESDTPSHIFTGLTYFTDYYIYYWEAPGGPYHLQGADEVLKDNIGYWVWAREDNYSYTTTGVEPASRDIHLIPGWNLAGFPITNGSTTPSNIFTGLTYFTDYYLYHWSAPGGPYVLMGPNEKFENYLGYWTWINTYKTVTVP